MSTKEQDYAHQAFNNLFLIYEYDEEQQRRWDKEEGEEIGLAKGLAKGENRFAALASALIEAGQAEDILKATKDMEYRQKLYKEYGIQ